MMIFGVIGLIGQIAVFTVVLGLVAQRRSVSFAALIAGLVAVYGYALIVAFCALVGMPWQVLNLALALALLIVGGLAWRTLSAGLGATLRVIASTRAAVIVIVVVLAIQISVAVVKPELSIDGQLYHGPVLVNLLQNGTLWGWSAPNEYLYYTDLTMAGGVNLATFTGEARFDDALQIPHLLLLVLLVQWALGARFRVPLARVAIGVLIASSVVIWVQPRILYVDLAYGVAVAASLLLPVLVPRLGRIELASLGILLGAVFATKPTGVLTGLVLLVATIVITLVRRRSEPLRIRVAALAAGLLPPLVIATAFYVRNLVAFGNPVFPVDARLGPVRLPGIIDLSVFASGERGSGLVDPGRVLSYLKSLGSGILHGVTKLDYDPRAGGFGLIPLAVVVVAAVCIAVQLPRSRRGSSRSTLWRAQCVVIGLVLVILMIQPSTFDTRYVIGPTVAALVVILVTTIGSLRRSFEIGVGVVAIVLAAAQIAWNERMIYPGVGTVLELKSLPPEYQAATPGNPWGEADLTSWMPDDECVTIALQTAGGITASGMNEASQLGALPYALYGDRLCNQVDVITLRDREADSPENEAAVRGADYLVVYRGDASEWMDAYDALEFCGVIIDELRGNEMFPQRLTVIENTC